MKTNPVLETTKGIIETSRYVNINQEAIRKIASRFVKEKWQIPKISPRFHFYDGGERTLMYFFILDSINFCFWVTHKKTRYGRVIGSELVQGYNALAFSLKLAFSQKHPIEHINYLIKITKKDLRKILNGVGELPLLEKRLHILHQNALTLTRLFDGTFTNVVEKANKDALTLLNLIITHFPSFNDTAHFQGNVVAFHKRAQLLVSDINLIFRGKGYGEFTNIDGLTAFADYKLPQILRHFGILEYEKHLTEIVDAKIPLKRNSPEELEIRANTIWAVEYLKEALETLGVSLTSRDLDTLLWHKAKEEEGIKPHHRVKTIYY